MVQTYWHVGRLIVDHQQQSQKHGTIIIFPDQSNCDMHMYQLVTIFYEIDDFYNELASYCPHYMLLGPTKSNRGPACGLSTFKMKYSPTIKILSKALL